MTNRTLLSIVESSGHPNLSPLYQGLGISEVKVNSVRKAIHALKRQSPDFVVAEFFYGYGNNYAGVNISNLDVLLYTLQKYAPEARVIVLVDPTERRYVDGLNEIFPLFAVLNQPVCGTNVEELLRGTPDP